jgi:hypothetical protein
LVLFGFYLVFLVFWFFKFLLVFNFGFWELNKQKVYQKPTFFIYFFLTGGCFLGGVLSGKKKEKRGVDDKNFG